MARGWTGRPPPARAPRAHSTSRRRAARERSRDERGRPPAVGSDRGLADREHAIAALRRPRGRDLSPVELEAFVRELADQPELWIDRVRHDPTQRVYEELISDAHLTAWLICWIDEQDTGFHDHDTSAGAVAVVGGRVCEERLAIGRKPSTRTFGVGDAFYFTAADIHRVHHSGVDPAVSLHVYSPPLARMGAYSIDEHGVLVRHTIAPSEELRPLAEVA
ncbi:MAG TPA: cysteine dioxygenase family protein [Solirubrobacteraceae bacterium]